MSSVEICNKVIYNIFVSKLCPNCHYLGKGTENPISNFFIRNFYLGAILISIGISGISKNSDFFTSEGLISLYSYFLIIWGCYNMLNYFSGGSICPKCSHKEMLPLDNSEAINLIKKYDLKVGENPSQSSQNEPSSRSLETPKL